MAAPRKTSKPVTKASASSPAPTPVTPVVERSEVKGSGGSKIIASAAAKTAPRIPTHSEIQKRAYEIYASRGYASGDPAADWHEAERQLKAGL